MEALATFSDHSEPDIFTKLINMILPYLGVGDAHVTSTLVPEAQLPGRLRIRPLNEKTHQLILIFVLPLVQQVEHPSTGLPASTRAARISSSRNAPSNWGRMSQHK